MGAPSVVDGFCEPDENRSCVLIGQVPVLSISCLCVKAASGVIVPPPVSPYVATYSDVDPAGFTAPGVAGDVVPSAEFAESKLIAPAAAYSLIVTAESAAPPAKVTV